MTLSVTGMTCGGCVKTVERVLSRVPGVTGVSAELTSGSATVGGNAAQDELIAALRTAGYDAGIAAHGSVARRLADR